MTLNNRRRGLHIFAAASLLLGAVVLFVPLCCQGPIPPDPVRGYANGTQCYYGSACYIYAKFSQCVSCCLTYCPVWYNECVDRCIEQHDPKEVLTAMLDATATLSAKDAHDPDDFDQKRTLLVGLQHSSNKQVSRTAKLLAREAGDASGLSFLSH